MMSIQNLSMYLAFFCFFFSNKTWMQHQCLHRYNNTGVSWRWGRWWCVASWSTITLQPEWICLLLQQKTVREVFTSLFVKRCLFLEPNFSDSTEALISSHVGFFLSVTFSKMSKTESWTIYFYSQSEALQSCYSVSQNAPQCYELHPECSHTGPCSFVSLVFMLLLHSRLIEKFLWITPPFFNQ